MSPGGATSSGRPTTNGRPGINGRHSTPRGRRDRSSRDGLGPIAVTWNEGQRRPIAFIWRKRRYRIERLLETWVVETGWWKDEGRVNRSYWRVRAEGRVFDLRYDRISKAWTLEQALN